MAFLTRSSIRTTGSACVEPAPNISYLDKLGERVFKASSSLVREAKYDTDIDIPAPEPESTCSKSGKGSHAIKVPCLIYSCHS